MEKTHNIVITVSRQMASGGNYIAPAVARRLWGKCVDAEFIGRRCKLQAKYVMTDRGPIIFPDSFEHREFREFNPSRAGKVIIAGDGVITFGDSLTLGLKPKKDDTVLIAHAFGIKQ